MDRHKSSELDGNPRPAQNSVENHLFSYEYTATPWRPLKIDRFRAENVVLCFALFCATIFSIAALSTPVSYLHTTGLKIVIGAWGVSGCVKSQCEDHNIAKELCDSFRSNMSFFVFVTVAHVLLSGVNFGFSVLMVCGRLFVSRHLVIVVSIVSVMLVFVATVASMCVTTSPLCKQRSLQSIGFVHGPAAHLCLTDFILLSVAILFYYIRRRCCDTPRYHH